MQALQVFKNENFGEVRTIEINNEPWFVAKDVCKALLIQNTTQAMQKLDEEEVTMFNIGSQSGDTNIINESGLYNLIMTSRKPEAKKFKKWVTNEVLPTIRKHGAYMTDRKLEEVLLSPDTLITLAQNLKDEQMKRVEAENKIKLDAPKVLFADSVASSKTTILVAELAKLIKQNGVDMGQKRLFEWMRKNGYLIKRKGSSYNSPTQKAMELGLFEIKESTIVRSDGGVNITKTTKVTGKGQIYFIQKMLNKKIGNDGYKQLTMFDK